MKTATPTTPPEEPAIEDRKVMRARLIDETKEFQASYRDAKGNTIHLNFNGKTPELDVPPEAEAMVQANIACPFPDVYDVNQEIPVEVADKLSRLRAARPMGMPGKIGKRVAR